MEQARPDGQLRERRVRTWTAPLILTVLPLLVYGRFIVLGDELANADVFLAYRPAHAWLASSLRHAHVPLWTSAIAGGFPLAFSEYGWFSPLNWLPLALAGGHTGYYLAVALYVSMTGVCAYLLARAWERSQPAALLAGLVFGQSLFVVGGSPLLNQAAAYWTLPALLMAVSAAFAGKRWGAPASAVVTALLLLGSHPQMVMLSALPALLLAVVLALKLRRPAPLVTLGAAAVLGGLVSAVRFLPTLPLVAASTRAGGLGLEASAIGSVGPHALLVGLVLPSLAIPRYLNPQWSVYVGPLPLALAAIGAMRRRAPAASTGTVRPHTWSTPFLIGIALAGSVLALGSYTPVYWLVARTPVLTYFREPSRFLLWFVLAVALLAGTGLDAVLRGHFRVNRRVVAVCALLAGLLVLGTVGAWSTLKLGESRFRLALQMRALESARPRDYPTIHYVASADSTWRQLLGSVTPYTPGVAVPLLALVGSAWWLGWSRKHGAEPAANVALLLVAAPLIAYGQVRLPGIPASVVTAGDTRAPAQTPPTGTAQDEPVQSASVERVYSFLPLAIDNEVRLQSAPAALNADLESYRTLARFRAPNLGLERGARTVDAYENLLTREQALLLASIGSERAPHGSASDLNTLAMGDRRQQFGQRWPLVLASGVGLVIGAEPFLPVSWPSSVRFEPGLLPADGLIPAVFGYRVAHPLPRAAVASEWLVVGTADEAIEALLARRPSADSIPTVVTDPAGVLAARQRRAPAGAQSGRALIFDATIVAESERRIEIETVADSDAILVLLDANTPGWSATVTGAPAPILNANVAFRGVPIPAGRQRVVFQYTPSYWRLAVWLTTLGSLGTAGWAVWALLALRGGRFTGRPALSLT